MSGDAVRTALEAARDALAQGNCHGQCPATEPCFCRLDAAAAIAAFLAHANGALLIGGKILAAREIAAAVAAAKEMPSG